MKYGVVLPIWQLTITEAESLVLKAETLGLDGVFVPDHILAKPGPLTPEEFQKIRLHPQVGADIIAGIPFPSPVAPLILSHHERWDGRGYPQGLRGNAIPLGARILCLVDYFDALTSSRPYHNPMSVDAALAMMEQEAGKALDPQAVAAFVRILPGIRAAAERADVEHPLLASLAHAPDAAVTGETGATAGDVAPTVFEHIAVAHREIYALYEIAQTMGTSLGVADTMAHIASKLSGLVPFSACALFLYDDGDVLHCRFATGTDAELLQPLALNSGAGLAGSAARNRRPVVNARPGLELEAAGSSAQTVLQSALVCPLISGDTVIGALGVYHTDAGFYREDHRRLLDRVCDQAAAVIHNAVIFEQTQEASLTDALTGLPNTRFMVMHLTRELARARRLSSEVSLIVMDLNDFKDINDTYGHHIGDRALREVSKVLRTVIRPYDVCVRYAGDEFIVVLAGCGREEAELKRAELQRAVDAIAFEAASGKFVPLSLSAGASVFPHDGDTYEALLATADGRMYADKGSRKRDSRHGPGGGGDSTRPSSHGAGALTR